MARGEVHRPSGVQHDIWNWVTLCNWPDCKIKDRRWARGWVGIMWSMLWLVSVLDVSPPDPAQTVYTTCVLSND